MTILLYILFAVIGYICMYFLTFKLGEASSSYLIERYRLLLKNGFKDEVPEDFINTPTPMKFIDGYGVPDLDRYKQRKLRSTENNKAAGWFWSITLIPIVIKYIVHYYAYKGVNNMINGIKAVDYKKTIEENKILITAIVQNFITEEDDWTIDGDYNGYMVAKKVEECESDWRNKSRIEISIIDIQKSKMFRLDVSNVKSVYGSQINKELKLYTKDYPQIIDKLRMEHAKIIDTTQLKLVPEWASDMVDHINTKR